MKRKTTVQLAAITFVIFALSCKSPTAERTEAVAVSSDTAWAMTPFVKVDSVNPVLTPGAGTFMCPVRRQLVRWEEKDVFNPAAVVRDNKIWMLYRAEDMVGKFAGTSRIGLAVSDDGLHFTRMPEPVLFPDNDSLKVYEWEGGIEDPRVVESDDGTYYLTYTAYDGKLARLLIASSRDLRKWNKHGLVLQGKYKDTWSKSGAVVARQEGERIIAHKINGKYWMYFGDTDLFMATSDDLIHWSPVEANGKLLSVLKPRPGYFDSRLVESGPYALVRDEGILLLYNGMNLDSSGRDPKIEPGAYCAGQALFDASDPTRLKQRLESNFMRPDKPYEVTGQVNRVCFLEGMVPFGGRWFLYYGTADSRIAVAVHE
ncbi:MAG TPA: glycoside hydrolase family 130 protein [Chryseosolibacter sp.]|nr:glycoside hydrolase family 130 protein [Chryseosolibacter sp.]